MITVALSDTVAVMGIFAAGGFACVAVTGLCAYEFARIVRKVRGMQVDG